MSKVNRFPQFSPLAGRTALALGVVVTLGMLDATAPVSAQGAWCAYYSDMGGGANCGFYTLQQCRWAISGVGGQCSPSPYVTADPPPRSKARRTQ